MQGALVRPVSRHNVDIISSCDFWNGAMNDKSLTICCGNAAFYSASVGPSILHQHPRRKIR